jgi:hypothetical protein
VSGCSAAPGGQGTARRHSGIGCNREPPRGSMPPPPSPVDNPRAEAVREAGRSPPCAVQSFSRSRHPDPSSGAQSRAVPGQAVEAGLAQAAEGRYAQLGSPTGRDEQKMTVRDYPLLFPLPMQDRPLFDQDDLVPVFQIQASAPGGDDPANGDGAAFFPVREDGQGVPPVSILHPPPSESDTIFTKKRGALPIPGKTPQSFISTESRLESTWARLPPRCPRSSPRSAARLWSPAPPPLCGQSPCCRRSGPRTDRTRPGPASSGRSVS